MSVDESLQHGPALLHRLTQERAVEREVHFVKADHRHGQGVELLFEVLHDLQLGSVELVVAVQDAHLHHRFDHVLEDLLGLLFRREVFLDNLVCVVEDPPCCVVDEVLSQ